MTTVLAFLLGFLLGGYAAQAVARHRIRQHTARWQQQHPDPN